ncbi:MAG: undecaprenyl-diphosphate phosphatase [Anaeroplasma sp.]
MKMNLIELIKIILLGIIEGITEWLPISSTGHMYIFDEFWPLNVTSEFKELFMVVIQLGAILAVVVIFFKKIWPFGIQKTENNKNKIIAKKDIFMMWLKVLIACIPTAILGFLLDDILNEYLYNGVVIAIMLILYGIAFILVEIWNKKRTPKINTVADITINTALMFGLFQALAMIPGTSRSGATIIGALIIGVSRTTAAEFTFFLAIPTMLGASLLKIVKYIFIDGGIFGSVEILSLGIGMIVAFAVSLLVIKFLMDFVKKHDFKVFGWYRIALGMVVLILFILKANNFI